MKVTWLILALLSFLPRAVLAQSPVVGAGPAAGPRVRILPVHQAGAMAAAEPPEPVPPGRVRGETERAMTLADLEAMALANSPVLARAISRVEAARGQWVQVGLRPNPVAGYSASEIGNEGRAGQQGAFIGQEFVTGGKLRLNRAVAAREIRVAEQQLAALRYRVLNDVRINFFEVLVAQRALDLWQELAEIGQRGVRAANELLQAQEVSRADLLQARVEANSARIQLANARNRYTAAWRRLTAVLGSPGMTPAPLAGDIEAGRPDITWDDALQQLLVASPELAAAQAEVDRARWAFERARAEVVPNLELQLLAQYDNSSQDTIAGVQAGIPIPILNRNQGGIRRAQAELAAARSDVRRVELDLQNRLAIAFERYANARQQVAIYANDILPDAKSSLDLVDAGYRQGEFGFLTLLTAQRTYFQTNVAYVEALRQLRENTVAIEGLLLTDSLRQTNDGR